MIGVGREERGEEVGDVGSVEEVLELEPFEARKDGEDGICFGTGNEFRVSS